MKNMKYVLIGVVLSFVIFLILGIFTALVPSNLFIRMISVTTIDYIFLILTSIMLGSYFALHFYSKDIHKKINSKEDYVATGGAIPSIFAFSCPICNIILVLLFGATVVLTYFDPLRPVLGAIGIGILGLALYLKIKNIRSCSKCLKKKRTKR